MKQAEEKLPNTLPAFFWHFIKKQWPLFLLSQIFAFAWSLDHTLFPFVFKYVVDAVSAYQGDRAHIWSVVAMPLAMGALLWISLELSYRINGFIKGLMIPRMESEVRMSMFNYVQHHSHTYFSTHFAGSLANKIADMPRSMTYVLDSVMTLFLPVILAIIISIFFFAHLHFIFATILGTWISIHMLICLLFSRRCDRTSSIHSETKTGLQGRIVDSFSNHLNIKLFARHKYEKEFIQKFQNTEQIQHRQMLMSIEKMKLFLGIAAFLGPGVCLNLFSIYCWQKEMITTGDIVFIFNTSWNILYMTWIASLELPNLFKEWGVCRQALTVVQDEHDIVDEPNAIPLKVTEGTITFDRVTFYYTPNHDIFQDKTISLKAGNKIGLVGFSGSGKSTFVHLILRFFDVEKGRILVDGQDISKVCQKSLRSQIAMIPQDTALFHRTIMDNIRYGRLDATDEEVIAASIKAHCHDFIEKLPEKYNTIAGERGVKLSGGQRQRIAIARAILKNAPILILDEATSSLDSVTEQQIQESLEHLMQNRTCIVIAHRLSTLSGMDRILVVKEGQIVEDGSHEELLAAESHYASMWNMQVGGFLPDLFDY